jgi:predicted dehydrogenase
MTATRWGIIGAGSIARQFAEGLRRISGARLTAVAATSQQSADRFGEQFDVPERYPAAERFVEKAGVDVVYVATPHSCHHPHTLICLERGLPVLCEKPLAINARQAREMVDTARGKGVFLMEAMFTRFLPLMKKEREVVESGAIGEVRQITADFGFRAGLDSTHRLFNPALGGGALLDIGIYPLALASSLFGPPTTIAAASDLGETGVDEQTVVALAHRKGELAWLSCAIRTATAQEAVIFGTDGWLRIHFPWWKSTRYTLAVAGRKEQAVEIPYGPSAYVHEAVAVMQALKEGRTEEPLMPLDETLSLARTMDTIRAQIGLRYPQDEG